MNTITAAIVAAEKELVVRESAAPHLKGIAAIQNASAIERLCDRLTDLHIQSMEGGR